MGQTGAFVVLELDSCLGGRGTAVETDDGEPCGEGMIVDEKKRNKIYIIHEIDDDAICICL